MSTISDRRKTRAVVYLLDQASHFNQLAKTCPVAFQADFYRLKDRRLADALAKAPEQFEVDSMTEDGLVGVTHRPSGRRVHLFANRLPVEAAAILRRLPVTGNPRAVTYPIGERSRAG
jgi:hypothetical protein